MLVWWKVKVGPLLTFDKRVWKLGGLLDQLHRLAYFSVGVGCLVQVRVRSELLFWRVLVDILQDIATLAEIFLGHLEIGSNDGTLVDM